MNRLHFRLMHCCFYRYQFWPLALWVIGLLGLVSAWTWSGSPRWVPPAAAAQDVLVMGGDWNYPPYAYLDENVPAGFDVEVATAAARAAGMEVEIVLGPWAEIRHKLDTGEIDAIIGMAYSAERDSLYDFSLSTTQVYFDIFVPANSDIQSADDLTDRRIIVQSGGLMHDYLIERGVTAEIITVENVPDALLALSLGSGDAALLNKMQDSISSRNITWPGFMRWAKACTPAPTVLPCARAIPNCSTPSTTVWASSRPPGNTSSSMKSGLGFMNVRTSSGRMVILSGHWRH